MKGSDHVCTPSAELKNSVIRIGLNPKHVSYIPNGVDIEKFNVHNTNELKKIYNLTNEKIVTCPRRLESKNGVEYFVKSIPEIVKNVRNVKFFIIGNSNNEMFLKLVNDTIKFRVEDYVIFTDTIPNNEMPNYYGISDIVILPSLKEATSIAGLEAMASGIPIIGTNVGGIPQIIDNGKTGYLVPPKDPHNLAKTIIHLLNNEVEMITMGLNARKKAQNEFSWEIISNKFLKMYKKNLQKKSFIP
jgi:glycosyltransferase involved in cell wall biosynthesis